MAWEFHVSPTLVTEEPCPTFSAAALEASLAVAVPAARQGNTPVAQITVVT